MAPSANQKKGKNRQATAEPEDEENIGENNGETSGDTSGELVPSTSHHAVNTPNPQSMVPGLSQATINDLMTAFGGMMRQEMQRFEQRLERIEQFLGPALYQNPTSSPNPTPPLNLTPLPTIETSPPHQNPSPVTITTSRQALRAEEVGYFDPEYQSEQGMQGSVVNAGKHVFYKDVYFFTDRLKDLAVQHGETDVKSVMTACLRGSALMWYSMELTELERTLLRDADLDKWYTTLIGRFKTRTAVALSQLVGHMYSLADMKHTSPRAFIQQMLHLAKSAEFHSTFNQLTLLWNQFAVNLRRDIPEPRPSTSLHQFMEQVDSKTSIWLELAQRQSSPQQQWQNKPALQNSASSHHTNGQRNYPPQQHSFKGGNNRFPPRVPIGDKSHAYLADVTPDGYAVYEEEEEANQEHHGH